MIPSFSPDGEQVAFAWNGEREDNFDIYVKIVGSSEVRRLTTNPAPDTFAILVTKRPGDCVGPRSGPRAQSTLFRRSAGGDAR